MVAIINTGRSIRAAFQYNENKVEEGVADLIMARNYPLELADMQQSQRLAMLLKTAAKNENVTRNSVHISLNFAPGETFSGDRLREIASDYMDKIGFGSQPYLVYQHHDAGHNHLHLVSVKVRPDGSRIDMQNIGKTQSEKARKELELKYGLVKAEDHRQSLFRLKPVDAHKVQYGKTETRRAIAGVLAGVLKTYKYTSVAELNAVLNLYNVAAEQGSEGSRTFQYKGIFYRVLDVEGNKVGVPIKASSFHDKPTLKKLEDRFAVNDALRLPHKARVKTAVDFALLKGHGATIQSMIKELDRKGIDTVIRQNDDGVIYGITYVDHQTRCIFNGSDLGKQYSAKGVIERCSESIRPGLLETGLVTEQLTSTEHSPAHMQPLNPTHQPTQGTAASTGKGNSILEELLQPEQGSNYLPSEWKKKKRKKKRGQSGYFGEVDHLIPWQIDHLFSWRPKAKNAVEAVQN